MPDDTLARDSDALELRKAGVTYEVIAKQLQLANRKSASRAVARALARLGNDDTAAQRSLELERLDRMHFAVWPAAVKGDVNAIDRALRISEARRRLLGLDQPVAVDAKPALIWEQEEDEDDARSRSSA